MNVILASRAPKCHYCKLSVDTNDVGWAQVPMIGGGQIFHLECLESYEDGKFYYIKWWPKYQVERGLQES